MSIRVIDGVTERAPRADIADFVIVGSGPGGATAARVLAQAGFDLIMVEEGGEVKQEEVRADTWSAFRQYWRDQSLQVARGRAFWPIIQGCTVGGTSPINGAIIHRMPELIHQQWHDEKRLSERFSMSELERVYDQLDRELHVQPVREEIRGNSNRKFAEGANALGWENNIIRRNELDCQGSGRCTQACPFGAKQSMDRTFLASATTHGMRLYAHARADRVTQKAGKASGVIGHFYDPVNRIRKQSFHYRARHGVLLAAGAVHTPVLMQNSGVKRGTRLLGRRFMGHPGTSILVEYDEKIGMFNGATQGHESTHFWHDGMKFEVVGVPPAIAASRLPGYGKTNFEYIDRLPYMAHWGLQIRAQAQGRVRPGLLGGRPRIDYSFTNEDVQTMKRALKRLGEIAFASGAKRIMPGVYGLLDTLTSMDDFKRLDMLPDDPRLFHGICAHLFGTTSMSNDRRSGVVNHDGESFALPGLYVTDASVLPTNMGVNPQHTICAFSWLIAEGLCERFRPHR